VRLTVNTREAATAVPAIRERLLQMNVAVPLIGDFHFNGHKLLREHPSCAEALAKYRACPVPLVVTDLRMPNLDGMELMLRLSRETPAPKVVVITAHGSERQAVSAMKAGAYDYFRKPFDNDELLAVVRRAFDAATLVEENERLSGELALSRSMVFASKEMQRVAVLVARVAPRDITVLITGESGTGKERVASAIVRASRRANAPYVRFNCASLGAELAVAVNRERDPRAFLGFKPLVDKLILRSRRPIIEHPPAEGLHPGPDPRNIKRRKRDRDFYLSRRTHYRRIAAC